MARTAIKSVRLGYFKLLFPSYILCVSTANDQKKVNPRFGRQIDIIGWLFEGTSIEGTSTILIGGDMSATPFLKRPNNLLAHFEDAPSFKEWQKCLNPRSIAQTNSRNKVISRFGRQIDVIGWLFEGTSTILIGGDMSATPFLKRPNNLLAHFEDAPSFKRCSGPKTI